jgi:hypothetical protein
MGQMYQCWMICREINVYWLSLVQVLAVPRILAPPIRRSSRSSGSLLCLEWRYHNEQFSEMVLNLWSLNLYLSAVHIYCWNEILKFCLKKMSKLTSISYTKRKMQIICWCPLWIHADFVWSISCFSG